MEQGLITCPLADLSIPFVGEPPLSGSRVFVLAPSAVVGVQPACAVALAATIRSYAPCVRTRSTLFPVVSVESASIDSDASLPCDHLCTLTVNEVWSV